MLLSLTIPDTWKKIEKCDVLLYGPIGKYNYNGCCYNRILDSISELCQRKGLTTNYILREYQYIYLKKATNMLSTYNRHAFRILLTKYFVACIKGKEYANDFQLNQLIEFWLNVLKKTDPKIIIGIMPDQAICLAGKKAGIKVYDFQHGVIADEHPWYGKQFRIDTPRNDLPDGFLTWDDSSANVLRKWAPQKGINVKVYGNPWFQRFLNAKPDDQLVQQALANSKIFNNNKPTILVTLQWGLKSKGYYTDPHFNGVMNDALENTIKHTYEHYNWLLRLHPIQLRKTKAFEGESAIQYLTEKFAHIDSVEWRICSELPLPVVLHQVDLHITDSSTVVIEAGWMGIRSGLLSPHICTGGRLENYFLHERNMGIAEVISQDTEAIKQWIKETLPKGRCKPTMVPTDTEFELFIKEFCEKKDWSQFQK